MGKAGADKGSASANKIANLKSVGQDGETDGAMPQVTLEPGLQAYIGQQLRTVYDEVLNEAIPDRLLTLLRDLERKQAEKS